MGSMLSAPPAPLAVTRQSSNRRGLLHGKSQYSHLRVSFLHPSLPLAYCKASCWPAGKQASPASLLPFDPELSSHVPRNQRALNDHCPPTSLSGSPTALPFHPFLHTIAARHQWPPSTQLYGGFWDLVGNSSSKSVHQTSRRSKESSNGTITFFRCPNRQHRRGKKV